MSEYNTQEFDNSTENNKNTTDPIVVETVREGNVSAALLAGLFSCIAVASVWAFISVNAEKQWLYMGIFAGLAVGWLVKIVSGGNNNTIGCIGAFFALLSCALGDFLTNVGFIAKSEELTYFQTLGALNFSYFFEIVFLDFDFFSFIIYGLATIEGWVFGRGLNKD